MTTPHGPRLSGRSLASLARDIGRPAYDRSAVTTGIVHLGIGAFHRAHQAVYTDDVLKDDPSWGILGASLRSPDTADALNPQDGLYGLATRSGEGDTIRVVGSIGKVIVAPHALNDLLTAMSDPGVRIVTLTVTEKGYCHDPATGTLNETHPDILHDLANPQFPKSAPGLLVEALRRRRERRIPPFTILTCDNLPSNGRTVARVVAAYARLVDPALGAFVEEEVAFPCTMVDRIVPATTDEDRAMIAEKLGVADAWPVMTEPFTQWVIEDDFPQGRPDWEKAGATFVADVEPFETMKLRMLNGSHSTLAYLGYLSGYQTVAEAIADAGIAGIVAGLMTHEVMPTLHMPEGTDLAAYAAALQERFRNPALKHRTWQIAMDGSQKLPQRLLGTVRDRLKAGASIDRLALGVAAWMRYVTGLDETGNAIDVRDPMSQRLRALADEAGPDARKLAQALLGVREIFGDDLPGKPSFTGPVTDALAALFADGARTTASRFAAV